jgi:hypothetical protein
MGLRVVPAAARIVAGLCVASSAACALAIGLNDLSEVPCVGDCDGGGDGSNALDAVAGDEDVAAMGGDAQRDATADVAADRIQADAADAAADTADAADAADGADNGTGEADAPADAARDGTQSDGDAAEAAAPCSCLPGYKLSDGSCLGYMPPDHSCLPAGLVALPRTGWVATSSPISGDAGDVAANALDGVECSRFSTGGSQATGQWFQLDMGATFKFSVVVLDATNDLADFPSNYAAYVSTDGATWGSPVATGLGSSSGVTTILFAEQTARYIKVQLTAPASTSWSIDEVKVFSLHPPSGTPLPVSQSGWTATSSINGATAPWAVDGDLLTRFTTATGATAGQWLEVNMGKPTTFSLITMDTYGGGPGCTDFARGYAMYASSDGSTWTPLAMGNGSSAIVTTSSPTQTAQYIQIQLTETLGPWWSIAEFNVYTPSP